MAKKKAPARAKKQTEIPGTERKVIKEVEDAADAFLEAKQARAVKKKLEDSAKDALIAVLKKHSLTVYKFDGEDGQLTVELDVTERVKVTNDKDATVTAGEGDDADDLP